MGGNHSGQLQYNWGDRFIIRAGDDNSDAWNGGTWVNIHINGQNVANITKNSGGAYQEYYIYPSQYDFGWQDESTTEPNALSGCEWGSVAIERGHTERLAVRPNTWYDFDWNVNSSSTSQYSVTPVNGSAAAINMTNGFTSAWYSGSTTAIDVKANATSFCPGSAVFSYRHTPPSVSWSGGATENTCTGIAGPLAYTFSYDDNNTIAFSTLGTASINVGSSSINVSECPKTAVL